MITDFLQFCVYDMASVCAVLSSFMEEVVEIIFAAVLAKFKLNIEDFQKYSTSSLPKEDKPVKKLLALHACACKDETNRHFVVKQTADIEGIYVFNFSAEKPEICGSSDPDDKILMHIFVVSSAYPGIFMVKFFSKR